MDMEETNQTKDIIKDTLLKNTDNHLESIAASCVMPAGNSSAAIVRNITSQVIDSLAVKHFVGVQPMTAPVGLIYSLEYEIENVEPTSEEMISALSSSENENEEKNIPTRMCLNINSQAIEAGTRKLGTHFTLEALEDINAGAFDDKTNPCTEIAKEIYEEIRNDISAIAHKVSLDAGKIVGDGKDIDQNKITKLGTSINSCANKIARKTRRGAGNFLIASETIAEIIKNADGFVPTPFNEYDYGYVKYIGTLYGAIKVYCDFGLEHGKAIIGYKGGNGETDTGYIYAPYILVMGTIVVDPNTFAPVARFMTRYGKFVNQPTEETTTENGALTTIKREQCNYYYELTLDNLPKLKDITFKIEEKKESDNMEIMTDITESISDAFEAAMEILN